MVKLGTIGDSNTDAYRGSDNRGGAYAAMTLNWLELLIQLRGADVGAWGSYSEPRRTDYARNWARSGAKSDTMLTQGQHTGLAAQLDASTYAICWIGTNDIRPDDLVYRYSWATIYNDASNPATYYANPIVADILTGVDALRAANPAKVLAFDYADLTISPSIQALWPDPVKLARLGAVFTSINAQLRAAYASRGVVLVPYAAKIAELLARTAYDSGGGAGPWNTVTIWGVDQIWNTLNNEPHYMQLADNHYSTVFNWIVAGWVIESLRAAGADIAPARPYEAFDIVGFPGRPRGAIRRTS